MLIEEYFQKVEDDIARCLYIFESHIIKDKRSLYIGIIEGDIYFIDDSVLHFIEFVGVREKTERYKYSYHYQDKDGKVIFRYDMAPHHIEIETFPHHKHINSDTVIKSSAPNLNEVFHEIVELIKYDKSEF